MRAPLLLLVSLCGVFSQKSKSSKGKDCPGGLGGFDRNPCGNPVYLEAYSDFGPNFASENLPTLMEFLSMTTQSIPLTTSPTNTPTKTPTKSPTKSPTETPSSHPSLGPSHLPSRPPSAPPTVSPSRVPTVVPTIYPTKNPTKYPSQGPTSEPSQEPATAPSNSPTSVPSNGPTSTPSDSSTSAPSDGPTSAPSDGPTSTPSKVPTGAPTEAPTDAPSEGPTNTPIESPSIGPSDEPTKSSTSNPTISPTKPQIDTSAEPSAGSSTASLADITSHPSTPRPLLSPVSTCQTQSGFFGSLTNSSIVVKFAYELETDPSVEGKMEDEVLPVLENKFNSFLLPVVFPSVCGGSDGSTQDQSIVGISARPDDQILEEFGCRQVEVAGNVCRVVLGELTLFTDDGRRLEVRDIILEALRSGMEDGSFVVAYTSIDRVSFVDLGDLFAGLEAAEPSSIGNNDSTGNNNDGLMVGLVLAAVGAALLAIGALVYRRHNNVEEEEAKVTLEPFIIPELVSPYGSMLDSEAPDALFTPSDSSIFFDNDVPGELSPRSELEDGGVPEMANQNDSTLNTKMSDTVGIDTPLDSSVSTSIDDDPSVEPSLPPAAEDSSISDESSVLASSTT